MGKIIQESDPFGRGSELGESIERGRLAYLYEKKGLAEAALREWQKAAKLAGHDDIDKIKETIHYLKNNRDEDVLKKAEDSVIGVEIEK